MSSAEGEALDVLARSRALWNRKGLDLDSDEVLAQILDFGSIEDWRALYTLMGARDEHAHRLRARAHATLLRVPVGRPHFWLAALASLGEAIDWTQEPALDSGESSI